MANRKTFKRRPLSMTSLIDVIFLLLLFFMLSSTFSKFGEIDLVTSVQGTGGQAETPPLFVKHSGDVLTVNGIPMTLEELTQEIIRKHEEGADNVILSIGGEVTSQQLMETMVTLNKAAPIRLSVVR